MRGQASKLSKRLGWAGKFVPPSQAIHLLCCMHPGHMPMAAKALLSLRSIITAWR